MNFAVSNIKTRKPRRLRRAQSSRLVAGFLILFCLAGCAEKVQVELPPVAYKSFPILEYHLIGTPEGRWQRTPDKFRSDLEWLYQHGYYPMNLRDILANFKGLPKSKMPVVLTFDDSTIGQFRYLPDGKLDPNCAVGILKAFSDKHPSEWPLRGTFFVLFETSAKDHNLFGQPETAVRKLRQLKEWGMEIGVHTYSHDRLDGLSRTAALKTLGRSYKKLSALVSQEIVSLSLPQGKYPKDLSVLSDYKLVVEVAGGLQRAPWCLQYDPLHIKRIQAIDSEWKKFFKR